MGTADQTWWNVERNTMIFNFFFILYIYGPADLASRAVQWMQAGGEGKDKEVTQI
jgi:hypothetical protein